MCRPGNRARAAAALGLAAMSALTSESALAEKADHDKPFRIESDNKLERVEFYNAARLRRDSGDDIRGDFISYDARTERFTVKSTLEASGTEREGRVRATIMPKKQAEPETPPDSGTSRKD